MTYEQALKYSISLGDGVKQPVQDVLAVLTKTNVRYLGKGKWTADCPCCGGEHDFLFEVPNVVDRIN